MIAGEDGACEFEVCKFLGKTTESVAKSTIYMESLTCAHDPFAILTSSDALACLLKLEILKQFDSIRILRIVLETAFSPSRKPFW